MDVTQQHEGIALALAAPRCTQCFSTGVVSSWGKQSRPCSCVLRRIHDICLAAALEGMEREADASRWAFVRGVGTHWPVCEYAADVALAQRAATMTPLQRRAYQAWRKAGYGVPVYGLRSSVDVAKVQIGKAMLERDLYPPGAYLAQRAPSSYPLRQRNFRNVAGLSVFRPGIAHHA